MFDFNDKKIKTPIYIIDEKKLTENLEILKSVKDRTSCKILLAQKAFSMFYEYELIGKYLDGTTASGLFEAKLGKQYMNKENHIFSAAYRESEFNEISDICGHIVFNSFNQSEKYKKIAIEKGASCGIRINPEHSTQKGHEIYDPCNSTSRLGVKKSAFREDLLDGIEGLHFHTLCEQNSDALYETLQAVEEKFGKYLYQMKWLNFGGGHHVTRKDYDIDLLVKCIDYIQNKYDIQVYLEPGEAVALNAGYLVSEILDVNTADNIAILDTSAACHMPDVLEMPYRPPVQNSGEKNEKKHSYILGSQTCLAGDVIGEYSFDKPLEIGNRLVFEDMAIYSMCKNNTFNGINLPSIAVIDRENNFKVIKEFGYDDFRNRLS